MNVVLVQCRWKIASQRPHFVGQLQFRTMQERESFAVANADRIARGDGSIAAINNDYVGSGLTDFQAAQLNDLERGMPQARDEQAPRILVTQAFRREFCQRLPEWRERDTQLNLPVAPAKT